MIMEILEGKSALFAAALQLPGWCLPSGPGLCQAFREEKGKRGNSQLKEILLFWETANHNLTGL